MVAQGSLFISTGFCMMYTQGPLSVYLAKRSSMAYLTLVGIEVWCSLAGRFMLLSMDIYSAVGAAAAQAVFRVLLRERFQGYIAQFLMIRIHKFYATDEKPAEEFESTSKSVLLSSFYQNLIYHYDMYNLSTEIAGTIIAAFTRAWIISAWIQWQTNTYIDPQIGTLALLAGLQVILTLLSYVVQLWLHARESNKQSQAAKKKTEVELQTSAAAPMPVVLESQTPQSASSSTALNAGAGSNPAPSPHPDTARSATRTLSRATTADALGVDSNVLESGQGMMTFLPVNMFGVWKERFENYWRINVLMYICVAYFFCLHFFYNYYVSMRAQLCSGCPPSVLATSGYTL
eukprot:gnl/Spiro4/29240_TR14302_c0_g4_i1.p2 gnl/Spiro4/29240_TR14302_c0_g4~~gnl/Spiro4/29240_TR14302_c0_g4_i1.p2  ORF type:complete len:346 (+),score=86.37 gnl/Spiro4/29240_TR14302_c0_g4_i1:979-2016(+)